MVRRRWLGSFLVIAGVGGLAVLPRPAHPTTCADFSSERLLLEPVSLEIGGSQDPAWVEQAREFEVRVSYWLSAEHPLYFVSGPVGLNNFDGDHSEAFDAQAVPAR